MSRSLTIATPCYNEEESLPAYFQRMDEVCDHLRGKGWEVSHLLINDGSRDGTLQVLKHFTLSRKGSRAISHPRNLGYGAAIKSAFALTQTSWLAFVDADTNYDQRLILKLVEHVDSGYDFMNVSILAPGGSAGYAWYRHLLSSLASRFYFLLLPSLTKPVYTMTCGFRLYRREWLARIFPQSDSFTATAEILLRALTEGARVLEFPANNNLREHGISKMRFWATAAEHIQLAIRTWRGRLGPPGDLNAHLRRIGLDPS